MLALNCYSFLKSCFSQLGNQDSITLDSYKTLKKTNKKNTVFYANHFSLELVPFDVGVRSRSLTISNFNRFGLNPSLNHKSVQLSASSKQFSLLKTKVIWLCLPRSLRYRIVVFLLYNQFIVAKYILLSIFFISWSPLTVLLHSSYQYLY